jgi:dolichyl-phosphate beta-glucosyltransferase
MQRGGEVAIGVRQLSSTHKGLRRLISESGNLLVRLTLLPGISDSQCGFKVFSAAAAEEVFRRQTIMGWGFDMEILAIAQLLHYRIEKFPIPDWVDMPNGTIHNEIKSAAAQTLKDLALIIWRKWTGKYKRRTFA